MLEFKVIENLKPNKDLTNILKNFKYKVINLQIILIINCNLYNYIYTTTFGKQVTLYSSQVLHSLSIRSALS